MVKPKHVLSAAIILAFSASCAWAAAVTNLSDKPQTIEIRRGGEYEKVVIEPNETWRVDMKVDVRYKSYDRNMNSLEEFVIWQDGSFGPQRPNVRGGRGF